MTFSYVVADLATNQTYQIRARIGDTVSTEPLLEDEEIAYFLSERNSVNGGAALACKAIAAKFSRLADTIVGPQHINLSQKAAQYMEMSAEFERQDDVTGAVMPFCGGISLANKATYDSNSDRVRPSFVKAMTDYAIAGNQAPENIQDLTQEGF